MIPGVNPNHPYPTPIGLEANLFPQNSRYHGLLVRTVERDGKEVAYIERRLIPPDDEFEESVDDWIVSNPPYLKRYWEYTWASYVISIRIVVWMQQLAARPSVRRDIRARAYRSIAEQVGVLLKHLELDVQGNHIIKNAKALLWAGRTFDGPDAERWLHVGATLLERAIVEQILDDGMHYERSPSYHAQVLADFAECWGVLDAGSKVQGRLRDVLPGMAEALVRLTQPDGEPSLFNDSGLHMAYSADECLRALLEQGAIERLPGDTVGPFALSAAGYFGYRKGGHYILVDCGDIGPSANPGHGHGDILSFEWTIDGKRFVVDAGVAEYKEGPLRRWAKSTAAHNTVSLDDHDQCEFWGSFRVGHRGCGQVLNWEASDDGFVLEGQHDGYQRLAGSPIARRRLCYGV